jgi:hypothetical protein
MSNVNRNRRRPSGWNRIGRGVALLMTLAACGRSSGCSGCSAEGPPFPEKDKIHSAVQVRLTDNGVGFLEDNLEPLLAQALPDGLNICLPGQGGDVLGLVQYGFCQDMCDDGGQGCQISIGIGGVDLELTQPATVRATITFSELSADIGIYANPIVDCGISIRGPGFPVSVDLNLSTPDPTRDLTFEIGGANYQLSQLDIQLHGNDGFLSPLCDLISGVINLPFLGDLLLDTLQGLVDGLLMDQINGFVEDFTCRTCETVQDCPSEGGATCEGGRCMLDGACLAAPLGVHGLLDVGAMLSSFSPGLKAELQYLITPGSYVEVENEGLSLGVIGGARADKSRCVPNRPQPPTDVEPPRAQSLRTNVDPAGRPYEVGIGISDLFIEHAMWAVFNSGTLCLGITSDAVAQLNVQTIGLLLRDLSRLTHGSQSLAITLSPQEVPVATFGGNVVVPDPENEGQYLLQDPLMTLQIPDLWLDFHAFVEGRWVRVFSLNADVEVPLGIAFDPGNGIIPVLGDLSQAIRNVEVANGEVMRDDPQALANLLPVLLGPLLPQLAGGLSDPIALPDIMGYSLDLQEHSIQGIENNTFLGIFANLERAPRRPERDEPDPLPGGHLGGDPRDAHPDDGGVPGHEPPTSGSVPSVRLAVDAFDGTADEAPMEAQWRVDQGTWSLFTPAREMVVRSPLFALQGRPPGRGPRPPHGRLPHAGSHARRGRGDHRQRRAGPDADARRLADHAGRAGHDQLPRGPVRRVAPERRARVDGGRARRDGHPRPDGRGRPDRPRHRRGRQRDGAAHRVDVPAAHRPRQSRRSHEPAPSRAAAAVATAAAAWCPVAAPRPAPWRCSRSCPSARPCGLRRRGQSSRLTAALLLVIAALLGACDDSASSKKNTGGADADTVPAHGGTPACAMARSLPRR